MKFRYILPTLGLKLEVLCKIFCYREMIHTCSYLWVTWIDITHHKYPSNNRYFAFHIYIKLTTTYLKNIYNKKVIMFV